MQDLLAEFILAVVGAAIGLTGQFLRKPWQRQGAGLVGGLVILTAVMSAILTLSTAWRWSTGDQVVGAAESLVPTAQGPSSPVTTTLQPAGQGLTTMALVSTTAIPPTSTSGPTMWTPGTSSTAAPSLEPSSTPTVTPSSTQTPLPSDTPTPTPTETPKPDRRRLRNQSLEGDRQVLYLANSTTGETLQMLEVGARQSIYSAAWSPDGRTILVCLKWRTSESDERVAVRLMSDDGSSQRDILSLTTAGQDRGLANAVWAPDGSSIALYLHDGPNDGVYTMKPDGSALERLEHSAVGEWPRYWSVDGEWIITIAGDGKLYALEAQGSRRLLLAELSPIELFDQRYHPWRTTATPVCDTAYWSWWQCK